MFPWYFVLLEELAEHPLQGSGVHFYDLQGPQMLHHHLPEVIMIVADEHGEDLQIKPNVSRESNVQLL